MGLALGCFGIFLFLLIFAVPLGHAMAAAGIIVMTIDGINAVGAVQRIFAGINSISLIAVPFFILSGLLMESGNISKGIVDFARAFFGHIRGGLGHVCVVSCMIFAAVSGSAMATALAFSNLLSPAMKEDGYETEFIAGLQACGGTLGPIIPPSILMIMYSSFANISVASLFMAGIVPGILMGIGLMICCYFYAKKRDIPLLPKISGKERVKVVGRSIWALLMPVIIIGGTMAGFCSPSEAGMVACLYGLIVGKVVYRGLKLKDLPQVFGRAAITSTTVLILMGLANMMGYMLARLNFASTIANFFSSFTDSAILVFLIIVVFLLVLGMVMESNAATVIFVPVLYPIANAFGIDPIQFALVVVICECIAQITPPVGALLSATASIQGVSLQSTVKHVIPMLAAQCIVLMLVVYIPPLSTWLPTLMVG